MSKWTDGARRTRSDIDTVCNGMPDEDAISTPYLFRLWASGTAYTAGDRVQVWRSIVPLPVRSYVARRLAARRGRGFVGMDTRSIRGVAGVAAANGRT